MTVKNYVLDINKTSLQHPSIVLRQDDYNIYTVNISVTENGVPVNLGSYTLNFLGITPAGAKIIDSKNFITTPADLAVGKFSYKFPKEAAGSKGVYDVAYFRLKTTSGSTSTIDLNLRVLGGIDLSADEVKDYITVDDTLFNALTSEVYNALTTEVLDNVGSKVIYRGPWQRGYVASSTNAYGETEGKIVNAGGASGYEHTDFIPIHKGDLVIANFASNNGVTGFAKFNANKNFINAVQQDKNIFTDLAYVATDELEYIVVSNAHQKLDTPTVHIIKNYANDYSKSINNLSDIQFNGYINPTTHEIVGSSAYMVSNMIPVRENEFLFLKLWASSGTSDIVEVGANGLPTSNIAVGENKLKYYNVPGANGKVRFVRYINRIDYNDVEVSLTTKSSKLFNKNFAMLGDSYVKGNKTDENLIAYNIASLKLGASYTNYGINGNTIASCDGYADNQVPMSIRYADMDDTLDIIGFEGGRNDYNHNIPIGTDNDTDTTTFKGALNVLCEGLIKKYLGKKLFGVPCWSVNTSANTAGATQLDYLNAFVHIVHDVWGIEVLDSRSVGVYMNSPEFLAKYTEDGNSISHLNADGHAMFANKVEDFLNTI